MNIKLQELTAQRDHWIKVAKDGVDEEQSGWDYYFAHTLEGRAIDLAQELGEVLPKDYCQFQEAR